MQVQPQRTKRRPTLPLTDEQIYQTARAIVVAEMQVITYREFLPILLGRDALPKYRGYNPQVDVTISNEFATAAFRLGHTLLSPVLLRLDATGQPIEAGNISLAASFFAPQEIIDNGGVDPILRGLAGQPAQEFDEKLVDEIRNFLFGAPGSAGLDLASLNMQRGRDHGLPNFNQLRQDIGMPALDSFADVSTDPSVQEKLALAYNNDVNLIDPWVGLLSEDAIPGSLVGETLQVILSEQFEALRDGDRFWYQNYLPREVQKLVEQQTLATIIRRNTDVGTELQHNVFRVKNTTTTPPTTKPKGPRRS